MAGAPPPPPDLSHLLHSGSSAPTKKTTTTKKASGPTNQGYDNQLLSQYQSIYEGLWGLPASVGYLQHAARSGMNLYEFEANERAKPAFKFSPRYQEEELQTVSQLGTRFGANGYQ